MILKHPQTGQEFALVTTYVLDNRFHGAKRAPGSIKAIVVHHTAGNTAGDLKVLRGLTDRKVSVKYLVADPSDGKYRDAAGRLIVWQLLPNDVIGWSVGATTGTNAWVTNTTSDSIEVSNLGNGSDVFERDQVEAVEALIAYEEDRCGHELAVFGHKEVAPGRKPDPYASFPLTEVKDLAAWHKAGSEEDMLPLDYLTVIITDLGDSTRRAWLKSAAKSLGDLETREGTNTFSVDASRGKDGKKGKADIFIDYATDQGLDCFTISTFKGQAAEMKQRNVGRSCMTDAACAAELAKANKRITDAKVALG